MLANFMKHGIISLLFAVVISAMVSTQSLDKELSFYGVYHSNPMNQLVHLVFVPLIWWSSCVALCYVPVLPLSVLGVKNLCGHSISYGTLLLLCYSAFYVWLDTQTGIVASALLLCLYLQAHNAVSNETEHASVAENKRDGASAKSRGVSWLVIASIVHVLSWYMQLHPGHAVFEGTKPALMDSLGQSLGVAPMFVVQEAMWWLGFMPDRHARVLAMISERRDAMCAAGQAMPWC